MPPKPSHQPVIGRKNQVESRKPRPRLVFEAPYIFRVKSERSLSHLKRSNEYLPCTACLIEAKQRDSIYQRPHSSFTQRSYNLQEPDEPRPSTGLRKKYFRSPPTPANLDRLSRPRVRAEPQISDNCNWNNFIRKKSKYAIKTPYGLCDLAYNPETSETRPPFINYGGHYHDKQYGEKRTFNSLAIHQLKHHEVEAQRKADLIREQRLRLQAKMYFREMEERNARAQEIQDRAARCSTEYRDNFRPPEDYDNDPICQN